MITKIAWLALAGALGSLARYLLANLVQRTTGGSFPWGTIAVNILGCFVVGVLWAVFEKRGITGGVPRTAILVGFMGAFTTFSTMILDTHQLIGATAATSTVIAALANLTLQNGVGLAALFAGTLCGRMV